MKFDDLILDGAMGSLLLEKSGVFAPAEQFNTTHPDLVRDIHRAYIEAGADVIYTNTFGVNPLRYPDDYDQRLREGIDIALAASNGSRKQVFVALDIGPTGKILGKAGLSFDEAYEAFAAVVKAAEDRTDYIVIETVTDLAEMRAAILAAKDHSHLPIAASMSFEQGGRSAFGCSVECFALTATALGVDAVGLNCSFGPENAIPVIQEFAEKTALPLILKPNTADLCPKDFAEAIAPALPLVSYLGSCCGSDPRYTKALKGLL